MPLVIDFTASQTAGINNIIILTDNSTGSDPLVVEKRVYVRKSNGLYLTNYTVWALANPTLSLDILKDNQAVNIKVDGVDLAGNIISTQNHNVCFYAYAQELSYKVTQELSAAPDIIRGANFRINQAELFANIIGAKEAVDLYNDISGAQVRLNAINHMVNNYKLYF